MFLAVYSEKYCLSFLVKFLLIIIMFSPKYCVYNILQLRKKLILRRFGFTVYQLDFYYITSQIPFLLSKY